ncbi:metal-dependent hydrolase [Campylobacter sp. LR185c]|uniref:aminofutalosine deaminase family hydrolase n=1 Tax=Campylobacter sp. LR185c TaxID=2014525 RepID=UPI001237DD1E|nr:metal-dependent hydrolase [Campylobacter sp. LR185c]KAA6227957.1 metal-dependent hydrolase [Campylobacter sp. LR185c]KAA8604355.1 chlorohydrolase [Campylobacter sp. LR185c]
MFLIYAKNIFVCDEKFTILKNQAFVFDKKIKEFGNLQNLQKKYPNAKLIKTSKNSLILPAFINSHTHLEFSANAYDLAYGDFITWLKSVIKSRVSLNEKAKKRLILNTIKNMQKTGTATIGAISSFGSDLIPCVKSGARIVYFNEILGSSESENEIKKADFLKRFNESLKFKNDLFIPAISLHSPYSTNLTLAKFALNLAKTHKNLLSVHFLESKAENEWLRKESGDFKKWFLNFNKNIKPLHKIDDFLALFNGQRTLFTHCVFLKEFEKLDKHLHSITHCAFSNRLLSQKSLNLKRVLKSGLNIHLGTDGLSSNISLSILDEMRANLLIHKEFELKSLAKKLLLMATLYPAKALNFNDLGSLEIGKSADFSVCEIGECDEKQLPLQFILKTKEVKDLFIRGEKCNL